LTNFLVHVDVVTGRRSIEIVGVAIGMVLSAFGVNRFRQAAASINEDFISYIFSSNMPNKYMGYRLFLS